MAAGDCAISAEFGGDSEVYAIRARQLRADPARAPWGIRVAVLTTTRVAVGHAGFHGPPGVNSLADPAGVEVGYTIMPAHRRQGFAEEAARSLFAWAATQPGAKRGIATIAPSNGLSLLLSAKLGMTYLTEVWDDDDGPEHVFWSDLAPRIPGLVRPNDGGESRYFRRS